MTDHLLERHYGGWKPSPPDDRDHLADPSGLTILAEVDPRGDRKMPLIFDQGQLGSCTSQAVEAALQYNWALLMGRPARRRSRLDIYYGERQLEGSPADQDTGAYGRDGFKFAQQTGVLLEAVWPYDPATFAGPPPAGGRLKLAESYAVVARSVAAFKQVLSNRQTIAVGFTVFDSFESAQVAVDGVVPMPDQANESVLGGHEILVIGYTNAHPGYFLCRNSWGIGWGEAGHCWMPEAYFLDPNLSSDFRTIVRPAA